jgi:4-hydroxythreonine-4-phosphate dehydrogenase
MKIKPIIIVSGEPNSIFFEIFFKSIRLKRYKSPLILICCEKKLKQQMRKFNFKKSLRIIEFNSLKKTNLDNKKINIINVNLKKSLNLKEKHKFSKTHIKNCFDVAFKLIKNDFTNKLINGPINKKNFLDKKYLGVTEYISKKFDQKKTAMLIFNKKLSVCPLTTHLPLKLVAKQITRKLIKEKIIIINDFFIKHLGFKPKIGVTGLNPHCESILKFNEDNKIVSLAIQSSKSKGYKVEGPLPADTIFLKNNRKNYDIILGMYHDQVLAPIKTLYEYDAINITMGLPFLRVSPDHGPNEKMVGKNLSNCLSMIKALNFLDQR